MTIPGIVQALIILIAGAFSFALYFRDPREISVLFIGGFLLITIGGLSSLDWGTSSPTLTDLLSFHSQHFSRGPVYFGLGAGLVAGNLLGRGTHFLFSIFGYRIRDPIPTETTLAVNVAPLEKKSREMSLAQWIVLTTVTTASIVGLLWLLYVLTPRWTGDFESWFTGCSFVGDVAWVGLIYSFVALGFINLVGWGAGFGLFSYTPILVRRIQVVTGLSILLFLTLGLSAVGLHKLLVSICA